MTRRTIHAACRSRISLRRAQRAAEVFILAVLALVGYPAWRIVALAVSFGFSIAMLLSWRAHNSTVPMFEGSSTRADTLQMVPRFLNMFVALALTGGIRSPLLPMALIPFSDLVIKTGWSRLAYNALALDATCLFALAVLPARWFGPDVPQPAFW